MPRSSRVTTMVMVLLFLASAATQAQEAGSATVVPIQVTGDPATRFSLVVLSDGYTAAELPLFRQHLDKHLNVMWSLEPFRSYRNYINVYAVEIVSGQSGITCDPAHREPRTTPLGMQFGGGCTNPNARGIGINQEAARSFARQATPEYDQILAIANTDTYGGIGGSVATTSGGNALGPYITPHELGHSLGRLQDEYTYSARGVAGAAYTGPEPNSIHHTLLTEEEMRAQQLKWWRWLGEPSESGGLIGRYEGGQSRTTGIWRPSRHSMMISLGYYFDQISLERMAQRISGQVELIAASTPNTAPVPARDVIWIETAHPVYHELDVRWEVDGRPVASANNSRYLTLPSLNLSGAEHRVTVKVVDPTSFVRDPAIRDTSFSATRSWLVRADARRAETPAVPVAFTASTQTSRALGGQDVVYVVTTQPPDRVLTVTWRLNGREVRQPPHRRTFHLASQNLAAGTHTLSATVTDPQNPRGPSQTLEWRIDNRGPTVQATLLEPVSVVALTNGDQHYLMRDEFRMKLEPTDDEPGYVVAEFRVNGDGWHHYYGWPDAPPGTPYLFTPRGTTIKELIYGSLSAEGLSPQPWEAREPGWGTHHIEYRARDASGNVGATRGLRVTFLPVPACTRALTGRHEGALQVDAGVVCLERAHVTGAVTVAPGAALHASNSTIDGTLTTTDAAAVEVVGSTIQGATRITSTTGRVVLFNSTLNRNVDLLDNTSAATLSGNRLNGALNCTGNRESPTSHGTTNVVRGRAGGQCARL